MLIDLSILKSCRVLRCVPSILISHSVVDPDSSEGMENEDQQEDCSDYLNTILDGDSVLHETVVNFTHHYLKLLSDPAQLSDAQ